MVKKVLKVVGFLVKTYMIFNTICVYVIVAGILREKYDKGLTMYKAFDEIWDETEQRFNGDYKTVPENKIEFGFIG